MRPYCERGHGEQEESPGDQDERPIAGPLADALRREGFDVHLAATAADRLEAFSAQAPDIVLLDVMLPDGDGRDVLRQIRQGSRTPVVMVSARGEEMDRVLGLELGADDYDSGHARTTAATPAPSAETTTSRSAARFDPTGPRGAPSSF